MGGYFDFCFALSVFCFSSAFSLIPLHLFFLFQFHIFRWGIVLDWNPETVGP